MHEELISRINELKQNKAAVEAQTQTLLKRIVYIEGAIAFAEQLLSDIKKEPSSG